MTNSRSAGRQPIVNTRMPSTSGSEKSVSGRLAIRGNRKRLKDVPKKKRRGSLRRKRSVKLLKKRRSDCRQKLGQRETWSEGEI